jgi:glycosyltransferase involved in cell wall biosynthesis
MAHADSAYAIQTVPAPQVAVVTLAGGPDSRLHETGASLSSQSLQSWEWLVVDGADDAVNPIPNDGRVKFVSCGRDESAAAAANRAVRATGAAYVLRLEPGDVLDPTALEHWLWFLESHRELAFADSYTPDPSGATRRTGVARARFDRSAGRTPAIALVRNRVFEAAGGYRDGLSGAGANWDLWARCAFLRHWGGTVPKVLVHSGTEGPDAQAAIRPEQIPYLPEYHHSQNAWLDHQSPCENGYRKQKRRILLVVPWLTVGGADQFNLALLDQLIARGWEASIVATLAGDHPLIDEYRKRTPDIFVLSDFLRLVDYPRFLSYAITSRRADVVLVSNSEFGYRMLPYLRASCPDVAFVDFCHSEIAGWNNGGYPRFSVEYQGVLDLTVTASEHLRTWLAHWGGNLERIDMCYVNVDADRFRPDPELRSRTRERLGLADGEPVVLASARLAQEKQPDVLVNALKLLKDGGVRFTALIAGDGPAGPWMRDFVQRNKLSGAVRFLGSISHDEVAELLTASDVLFLPSRWEGIALALYEAMASGVPVVAADVGGQVELVTPDCGVLVPRSFAEEEARLYAEALSQVLSDGRRREALGRAARERISAAFRLEAMGARMDELLTTAIRLHEADPRPVAPAVGRAAATETIEYMRLLDLTAYQHSLLSLEFGAWRQRSVALLDRFLGPTYRWAVRHGMPWLEPVKDRVVGKLLPLSYL